MDYVNHVFHNNTICEPSIGWDKSFSESDKKQYNTIVKLLRDKRGFDTKISEALSYMILYKQKYNLKYSDEQEEQLNTILKCLK
jgi:hypothetical protein